MIKKWKIELYNLECQYRKQSLGDLKYYCEANPFHPIECMEEVCPIKARDKKMTEEEEYKQILRIQEG